MLALFQNKMNSRRNLPQLCKIVKKYVKRKPLSLNKKEKMVLISQYFNSNDQILK